MDPHIVGRAEPLERLDGFLRGLGEGASRLVIEGEAGIGKTTVWQAAVDSAVERGYLVLTSRPAASETALAYSGLADLLANADDAAFDELPEPQRQALEVALLISEPSGRPPEPRAVFTAFGGVVRALADAATVLIAIDDLQWLDRSSLRALEFASRRIGSEPVGILATVRLGSADPPVLSEASVLRLEALSPAALHHLVKAQVGVNLLRPAVLRIHRMTGGNPFFALELARLLVAADLPSSSDPWPVPDDLRELVSARVRRLPKPVASALLVAAADGTSTISGLTGTGLRTAEREAIVTVGGNGQVRFAHPLFASAIYENAGSDELRRVHARLAAAAVDLEERARHRALASEAVDEEVAALLDEAARRARFRGSPDIAAELEEHAIALTPPDRPELSWQRCLAAAEDHFHAGDLMRSRELLLLGMVDAPAAGALRSRALRQLGEVCFSLGELDEALGYLRAAVIAANGDPASVATAELDLAWVLFRSFGSFDEAAAAADRALAAAEKLGDDALLSCALATSAATDFFFRGCPLDEQKLERALSLEDPDLPSSIERRPSFVVGWMLLHSEQFDRARRIMKALHEHIVERGAESDLPELISVQARLECLVGNLEEAAALADYGFEVARQSGSDSSAASMRGIRALIDAHAGRVEETRVAAAEAIAMAERSGVRLAAFWASTAIGLLELSLGNDEAVVATLASSTRVIEERGLVEPSRQPFLPDVIEALVHLGELGRADQLTAMLEERGRALRRPWVVVAGARCRALVLAAGGAVPAALTGLDQSLALAAELAMPLEVARTLIVKGQLERRRKQKRKAAQSLRRALELCDEIGAVLWAGRARSELARLGRIDDPDDLTATEVRVASLAASGLTNREIAATAFMSQKTVEANLSRIYRKLGIRSRAELGLRLGEKKRV